MPLAFPTPFMNLPPTTASPRHVDLTTALEHYAIEYTSMDSISLEKWHSLRDYLEQDEHATAKWSEEEYKTLRVLVAKQIETVLKQTLTETRQMDAVIQENNTILRETQLETLSTTPTPTQPIELIIVATPTPQVEEPLTTEPIAKEPLPSLKATEPPLFSSTKTLETSGPQLEYQRDLVLWLKADAGLHLVDASGCATNEQKCHVSEWRNQVPFSSSFGFIPATLAVPQTYPILTHDVQSHLPSLYFSCPMELTPPKAILHDKMTLFFVVSPATKQVDQSFFGYFPKGHFGLHNEKATFSNTDVDGLVPGKFSLIAYRLDMSIGIKVNGMNILTLGMSFGSESSGGSVVFSPMETTFLGHATRKCDKNSFQGRISEVLVYNSVLTTLEIEIVETYLMQKWGISKGTSHHQVSKVADAMSPITINSNTSPTTRLPSVVATTYDPNDVFKWTPPSDHPSSNEWKEIVASKIRLVEQFQYGGNLLHEYIDQLKHELNAIRSSMF
ncbi:hypothetical protein THRCLA_22749 [Thraustotheca clavata]|uniref:Uncharacterized protein n=1 Tax=Thraustotheca clavata TaxID=74557 RepID=A0A1V9YTG2_9STRA|nr:hypothetical protein THRCLA_22749 [Thraustotheca clavata]